MNAKKQIILLTGPPGIGKTTIIKKIISAVQESKNLKKSVSFSGFFTEECRVSGSRIGFDVIDLLGNRKLLARIVTQSTTSVDSRYRIGRYAVDVKSFESIALPALNIQKDFPVKLLIVDEIGKMELLSKAFKQWVREFITKESASEILLATIPTSKSNIDEVEKLRMNHRAIVFEVNQQNRNLIVPDVIEAVANAVGLHTL